MKKIFEKIYFAVVFVPVAIAALVLSDVIYLLKRKPREDEDY